MTGYFGWRNFETWRIADGLQTEQPREVAGLEREARQQAKPVTWLAEELNYLVRASKPAAGDMYGDLLKSAIEKADFYEIAETYLAD